jgi:hypothetical protein
MQNMRRTMLDQISTIAHERAERADLGIRAERALEQAQHMQLLQPLSIVPIALAPWHGLDMTRVDEIGRDTGLLQQIVDRDSKDTGGLHHHCINTAGDQPGDQRVQIGSKGEKHPHGYGMFLSKNAV